MASKINVAIDGPAGAGKSTVARLVASRLGYVYVDTGAMYRAVTLKALRNNVPAEKADELVALAEGTDLRLVAEPDGQHVLMDGEDVTKEIRSSEVTASVSAVSAVAPLRSVLVKLQKKMAQSKGVVMDGRDIGTNVLPDAEVKVFLTASARIRAERRYQEISEQERRNVTIESLMESIVRRDNHDSQREASPLRKAEDAVEIDTSELNIEEVAERILDLCDSLLKGGDPVV
ncbi:(d)CMP kinase [Paenibacillus thermotolerans]|uniref:(d)CMP kinase n=1 Tax=Paenibacillus thermotolerans TaxID=3027807 RepID=UPI0023687EFD|nr:MULTISPECIES: (d)CMP kinase [unclassified Paenibacillus]